MPFPTFKEQLDVLDAEEEIKPKILVNTFEALETNALKAIENYDMIGIGPLVQCDTSFGVIYLRKLKITLIG